MSLKNAKHQRFCEEYLVDLNAAAAYRRAGYTARGNAAEVNGVRLLRNAQVAAEIERLKNERSQRVQLTADEVLRELKLLVLSDIDHYSVDGRGKLVLEPGAPAGAERAVARKRLRVKPAKGRSAKKRAEKETEIDIWLWDNVAAIRMAMAHLGITHKLTLETVLALLPREFGDAVRQYLAGRVPGGNPGPGSDGAGELPAVR